MNSLWIAIFWTTAGLLYAQVGYVILLRMLTWQSQKEGTVVEPAESASVTVIIPAYNEESVLKAKLENTLAIDYPPEQLEVLVASDGSSDRTVEIARSLKNDRVQILAFPQRRGKATLLNDAVQRATGDVLCVCDANVMFRSDALKRLVARLEDSAVGAVSGDVRLASKESDFGEGESAYYRIERTIQLAESRLGSMMGVDGGMYVVRRDLFQPLPADTIIDDFVLSMRVVRQGKRVVYEPSAIATENATPTARHEFQRRVRVSAGGVQALKRGHWPWPGRPIEFWQFVSHKLLRWLGPLWLLLMLSASAMLWNIGVVYRVALAGQVVFYGLAAAATASTQLRQTRTAGMVFYFAMSHLAMGIGLVKGLLNLQSVTWNRTERAVPCTKPTPGAST